MGFSIREKKDFEALVEKVTELQEDVLQLEKRLESLTELYTLLKQQSKGRPRGKAASKKKAA